MKPVANRRFTQVVSRRPKTGDLICSVLTNQSLDLKLQFHDGTLPAVSPMLKGLRLLEEFWPMTEFDHLRTKHAAFGRAAMSQEITSEQRLLRLLSLGWECSGRTGF
jgi:hypothetical protein